MSYLKAIFANRNKKIFGFSSEKIDMNQISFFNEVKKHNDTKAKEPVIEEITYKRSKKASIGKKDNLVNLERVIIEHKLEENDLICKQCGRDLTEMGIRSKKEIIKYVPARLVVEEYIMYSYASCKSCEKETGASNIVATSAPKTVFYNSMASNELITHTITLKYLHYMPLNRQQAYFDMMGAMLSRQTLYNWTMVAANVLEPLYKHMKESLLQRNYIHVDETVLKVINDDGKNSKVNKYMWLYMSETEKKSVILYE